MRDLTPQQYRWLMEALRLAHHKQFGVSSEKTDAGVMGQLSLLFNEAEVFAETKAEPVETAVVAHKRHKKHEYTLASVPKGIPTEQVEHRLSDEELECPQCGETMTVIGKEVVRKLKITPAKMVLEENVYYTYAYKNCNETDVETPMVKAPHEKSVIPSSFAAAHHDSEVYHGIPSVSARAGTEPTRHPTEPSNHVQLNFAGFGGVSGSCLRAAAQGTAYKRCTPCR